MKFYEKIKLLRVHKDLSQQQLAKKAKLSQSAIAHIENGIRDPSISSIERIAKALDCKLHDLFNPKLEL